MPRTRGKTPGWAAVNLQLRHEGGVETNSESDPYPPIKNIAAPPRPCRKSSRPSYLPVKPGTSFVLPSANFAAAVKKVEMIDEPPAHGHNSCKSLKNTGVEGDVQQDPFKKLKEQYCWADMGLIEDIMLAGDNDIDRASGILNEMFPPDIYDMKNEKPILEPLAGVENADFGKHLLAERKSSSKMLFDLSQVSSILEGCLEDECEGLNYLYGSSGKQHSVDGVSSNSISLANLKSMPVEPEWEEDDVYLSHRKDAIKLTRSAAHHSKMASSCFLKGDHHTAQQHSLKAQEEWLAAKNLNAKAAKEILSVNNINNDIWKLDLHGLHAVEAVHALQERLWKIETQFSSHSSVSPKRDRSRFIMVGSSSSSNSMAINGPASSSRQRSPPTLQVITGRGIHSKGHPALPAAVRSFLDENGYRYDESRPGAVMVRPKFRRGKFGPNGSCLK